MEQLIFHRHKYLLFIILFIVGIVVTISTFLFVENGRHFFPALIVIFIGFTAIVQSILSYYNWKKMRLERESLTRALYSKEGYLQLFFENARDSIAVFDLDSNIIDVNPAFEELYGWKRSECIGKQIPLIPPERLDEANKRVEKVRSGQSFDMFETIDMKKDGTYFHAQISLSPIFDRNDKMIAMSVISRDISYKVETEKMIIQSEKLQLAGEIAAGVAHEIRNPMTVISGFMQMMNSDPNHSYKEYTQVIQSELERINLIIGEFLVLSKPQAIIRRHFMLDHVLKDVCLLFQPELNLHGIEGKLVLEEKDIQLYGEQNQLKQVFINLIKNAIEATESGRTLEMRLSRISPQTVQVSIRDEGIGMTKDVLQQIFQPFFTTKQKGTGLGMMISEKIITEHGGTIEIDSEVNLGTTVRINLPVSN
ncbi:ATP-binding protein [Paenisporosarcina cavernae]|uniref:histidine kinase n=1 Tax=Paenisporosarcina cavernae TaxID=2320858 RepID=A0A385YR40_9BACL|nr:ATP-binding protein [Paenisporosarcina cavernae]AYC29046.1 PAS domain S-box protein [Paenisporosarcina cavernae]